MEEIYIGVPALTGMALCGIVKLVLPFVFWFVWRKKTHAAWSPLFAGVLGYLVIGTVRGFARTVLLNPMKLSAPWGYYLWQAAFAGVFEECGRYLVFRFVIPNRQHYRDSVSCGIGHGGLEHVLVENGSVLLFGFFVGLAYRLDGLEAFAPGNPAYFLMEGQDTEGMLQILGNISEIRFSHCLFMLLDSFTSLLFHCCMSVLVFIAVHYDTSRKWLAAAVVLHTLTDVIPAFYFMDCIRETEASLLRLLYDTGVCYLTWRVYEVYGLNRRKWGEFE